MKLSSTTPKQEEVISWIRNFRKTSGAIKVSSYCYNCFLTESTKTKTLIVFPEEVDTKGIITIDKPLDEVELTDIIKLCKRIAW
ncbi:MAG: hypothetical protein KI790_01320 [Cyclobacteriaceae bacterium]|nr:hypothetical protein [Cyclobacteriaceae bacterium HetDA_MAG_MS6]